MNTNVDEARPPADKTPLWRRPMTWIVTGVLTAAGLWLTPFLSAYLNTKVSAEDLGERMADPDVVKVLSLERVLDVDGRIGYVVPPGSDPRPMTQLVKGSGPDEPAHVDAEVERRWVEANHAVDLDATAWQLTLEGNRTNPVVISDIRPVEVKCGPPLTGGLVDLSPEGEGKKIVLKADIEATRPSFTRIDLDDAKGEQPDYFSRNFISLERNEKVVLILVGTTYSKHCTWRYRISYPDGSPTGGQQIVSAPGNVPFESTGRLRINRDSSDKYAWVVPNASMWRCDPDGPLPIVNGDRFREYIVGEQGFCL